MRHFAAFLSHDWGTDELDRDNHARVQRIATELEQRGHHVWLDTEEMRRDINKRMADGIDESACMLIFITKRYIDKAGGYGPNGANDNVKYEFDYALRRCGVERLIPVVMEPSCRDPRKWRGVVGGKLGGLLYTDLSADSGAGWDDGIAKLVEDIGAVIETERVEASPAAVPPKQHMPLATDAATAEAPAPAPPVMRAAAPAPAPLADHPRMPSRKVFVASADDAAEEEDLLKRGGVPTRADAEGLSADGKASKMGLVVLFKRAGVTLTAELRDAAIRFCEAQQVASMAELVEYDSADDFLSALNLAASSHPWKKLRGALENTYVQSLPWHQRLWYGAKGVLREVAAVPGAKDLVRAAGAGRGEGD